MKKFFTYNFKTYIINKAGHWVQQEKPEETFIIINNFYKYNMKENF